MTREMKLGLLVGLAFMILIGVLLSDFVQQRVQPVRADLVGTSANVRRGVAAPGSDNPGTVLVKPPINVEPTGQVVTNEKISQDAEQKMTDISVGPPTNPSKPPDMLAIHTDITPVPGGSITPPMVPAGKEGVVPPAGNDNKAKAPTGPMKTYVAVDGDNLTKIATKMYGKWTPKNGELILKANPSMGPEGRKIAIGAKYSIPALPTATPAPTTPTTGLPVVAGGNTTGNAPVPTGLVAEKKPVAPKPAATKTYTVKEGDTLEVIAKKQAGGRMADLLAANKDVVKDPKKLKIGMVLKIPVATTTSVATVE